MKSEIEKLKTGKAYAEEQHAQALAEIDRLKIQLSGRTFYDVEAENARLRKERDHFKALAKQFMWNRDLESCVTCQGCDCYEDEQHAGNCVARELDE